MDENRMTTKDAARYLGVSRSYIYDLMWAEKLPFEEKAVRTQYVVKKSDLDKLELPRK